MTLQDFYGILGETGLPVAYRAFEEDQRRPVSLPYIIYYQEGQKAFYADNREYVLWRSVAVELYTRAKDPGAEEALEGLFRKSGFGFEKMEYYWDDEHLHETLYELRI